MILCIVVILYNFSTSFHETIYLLSTYHLSNIPRNKLPLFRARVCRFQVSRMSRDICHTTLPAVRVTECLYITTYSPLHLHVCWMDCLYFNKQTTWLLLVEYVQTFFFFKVITGYSFSL